MLVNENMEIIAAPSREHLGRHLSELPYRNIPNIVNDLQNGTDIYEYALIDNLLSLEYVLFTKRFENGWHMGILTPIDKYYQNAIYMRIFKAALGVLLAFSLSIILLRIEMARRKSDELTLALRISAAELQYFNDNLQKMVEEKTQNVTELQNAMLKTMAELLESRDDITGCHIGRTQRGVKIMLEEIERRGLYPEETKGWNTELLLQSCQLHDVGKISISDSVLKKPGKLTEEEYNAMKRHTSFGEKIIEKIEGMTKESEFLKYAKIFAANHHEKWDGSGYHNGLKGDNIPLLGRIMAIADVYDALTSERPYKKAFTHEESVRIINEGSGTYFDPALVEVFNHAAQQFRNMDNDAD